MSFRYFLLPLIACFVLSSCFEIKQDLSLQSDGSGEFTMTFDLPDMGGDDDGNEGPFGSEEKLLQQAEKAGLKLLEQVGETKNGRTIRKLRVAFDDVSDLNAFFQGSDEGEKMSFSLEEAGNVVTLKHLWVPEQSKEEEDASSRAMTAAMFKDAYYTVVWTMPSEITEASAVGEIEGNTVKFKIPFTAMMPGSDGVDIFASYEAGRPMWLYIVVGLAIVIVLFLYFKKKRA